MTTSAPLKLALVFGASGLAALTPAILGGSIPASYVGIAGVVVGVAYGLLHYLEMKEDGTTQETFLQAVEDIITGQIPNIVSAVAALSTAKAVQGNTTVQVNTAPAEAPAVVVVPPTA